MNKSRLYVNIIQLLSLLFILTITLLTIIPALEKSRGLLKKSSNEYIVNLEKSLGLKIQYEKISSVFSTIILEDVYIETISQKTSFKVQKLEISFDLFEIISLKDLKFNTLEIIENINILDSDVTIDLSDNEFFSSFSSGGSEIEVLPFSIKSKGLNLKLIIEDSFLNIDNCRVTLWGSLSKYKFRLDGDVKYNFPEDHNLSYFSGRVRGRGEANSSFSNIYSNLVTKNVNSDIGSIKDQEIDFSMENMILSFNSFSNDFNYLFKIEPLREELFLSIDSKSLALKDLIYFKGEYETLNNYENLNLIGDLKVLYNFKDIELLYSFNGGIKGFLPGFNNNINLSCNTIGNLDRIDFRYAHLYSSKGSLSYYGYFDFNRLFPGGTLKISNVKLTEDILFNSSVELKAVNRNYLSLKLLDTHINEFEIGDIPTLLYIDDEDINLKLFRDNGKGLISLSGNYDRSNKYISSTFTLDNFNINGILDLFNLGGLKSSIDPRALSLEGSFEYDFNSIALNINDLLVSDINNRAIIESDLRFKNKNLYVDHLSVEALGVDFVGRIDGEFGKESVLNTDCLINDNKYQFTTIFNSKGVEVSSNSGLDLKVLKGAETYIELSSNKFPISYMGYNLNPTIELKSSFTSIDNFLISIPEFSTDIQMEGRNIVPRLSFKMDGNNNKITIDNIVYKDNSSPLKGSITLIRDSLLYRLNITLEGESNESYLVDSTFYPGESNISANINVNNGDLSRLFIDSLKGRFNTTLSAQGSPENYSIKGGVSASDLLYNQKLGNGSFNINANNRFIALNEFSFDYHNNSLRIPLLTYNYQEGTILGSFTGEQRVDTISFVSDNSIDFNVLPVNDIRDISGKAFSKVVGKINISSFKSNSEVLFKDKVVKFFNNSRGLQVYTNDRNLRLSYFYDSGKFYTRILKPYFASFEAEGLIKDGEMDILVSDLNIDASLAEIYIPFNESGSNRIVEFDKLDIRGQVGFIGKVDNPIINGLLYADTKIDVDYIPAEIEPVRINLRIKDNELTILPAQVNIGSSSRLDLKGSVAFNSWVPTSIILNSRVRQENKIPVRYQYESLEAKGSIYTDGIDIYWEDFFTLVKGEVVLIDSEFTQVEKIEKVSIDRNKENIGGVEVDLMVEIGTNNILYYPSKAVPTVEAVASSGDRIDIKYNSISEKFSVDGVVTVKEGVVAYSGKPFILREGRVELKLDNDNIDPKVLIVGSKSVVNSEDEKIDIILTYSGGLISGLEATWDSTPKLESENAILALLGLATFDEKGEIIGIVADSLLTSFVTEPVEAAIRDVLNIDYVNIDTRFLTNITKDSFEQDDETRYNLSELLSDNSISIGDYITDDLFIKGKLGTKYEDNKLGPDLDLSLTLDTPHFQLGFTFSPMLDNTKTYFSPELGIELKWRWVPGE